MQDILNQIAGANATAGGNFIRDGEYLYTIKSTIIQKGHTGVCWIAELRVDEARQTEKDVEPNPVGSIVSMICNFTKHVAAPGNAKAYVLAAVGNKENEVTQEQMAAMLQQVVSSGQPLCGVQIRNSTYRKMTRDNKTRLTLNRFEHVPNQSAQDIAGRRREIEEGAAPPAAPSPAASPPAPVNMGPPAPVNMGPPAPVNIGPPPTPPPSQQTTTVGLPGPVPTTTNGGGLLGKLGIV